MKKKNIAWLLSAAMILTTAAAPVETVSVYAAEEFQADETEVAGTENGDTATETTAEIAVDAAENETAGADESEETVAAASDAEGEEETESEGSEENAQADDASNLEMFDDSAEELNVETEAEAENGFSDGEAAVAGESDSSEVIDSGNCGNDATYTLYGDGRLVIEGSGVVSSWQFRNDERIKSVEIGEGITSLNYGSWDGIFQDCKNLTSVTLPKSLTSIGNYTFSGCSGLTSINIPDGVTTIESSTFYSCSGLQSIVLPESVTTIGESAFQYCSSLSSIALPDSLTTLGEYAFGSTGIKDISLPDSLTDIGTGVFSGCSDLRSVKLPSGIKRISNSMFSWCERLNSIVLPDGVTEIGENAFSDCGRLTEINLPAGVTTIEAGAFRNTGVTEFKLPNGLKTIGDNAFAGGRYSTITVPESVTEIGESAFASNDNLKTVELPDSITEIKAGTFNDDDYIESIKLPENLQKIGNNAFYYCQRIKTLEIPKSVTEIGEYAFGRCYDLEKIVLPESLTNLAYGTFLSCEKLTDISIPVNVTKIDTDTFKGCSALRSVCIPGNSVKIEKRAIGYNSDTEKNSTLVLIGHKGSTAETYAAGENFAFHNVTDPLTHYASVEPTCINEGNIEYWHCNVCGKDFSNEAGTVVSGETKIEKLEHKFTWVDWKEATCTEDGNRGYWHCESCGKNYDDTYNGNELESVVYPATGHELELVPGLAANCWNSGRSEYYQCMKCGKCFLDKEAKKEISDPNDELITPILGHEWSEWKLREIATGAHGYQIGKSYPIDASEAYQNERTCKRCGQIEFGEILTYTVHVNVDQITLKYGQSTTAVRASSFTKGDYVKSVTARNKNLVTVSNVSKNGTFKLTAKNRSGKTYVDINLKSGVSVAVMITVQKGKVSTRYITNLKSTRIYKGKTVTLKPVLDPITSQDKVTYSTSNKNIATVNSKGVVTGKQVGTAKITVKAGSKKSVVTIKVMPKVKTTKLTGVPKTKTVNRGKTFTIKAVATPRNTDEKVTYRSSNKKIATVTSKGVVKGIKKGTATITVQSGSKKLTCKVTVK